MTARAAALTIATVAAASACGPPRGPGTLPDPVAPSQEARDRGYAATSGSYGDEPKVTPTPVEQQAIDALTLELSHRGAPPHISPALVLAARDLARAAATGVPDPLSPARLRGALARALSFDPAPIAHLVVADAASAPGTLARVARGLTGTHLGVGAAVHQGRVHLVLLVARRTVALRPFPQDVAAGTTSVLAGEVIGLVRPSVHVTTPSGESRSVAVRGGRGRAFESSIRFDSPGRWVVEVVGEGGLGPEVAALLAVSCGGAPLVEEAPADGPEPASAREAEARVVAAVNAIRRVHGLPPLEPWAELTEVARRHSEAMLAAGVLAHRLPGSNGPGERLRRAHVPFALVLENVAKGPTSLAAHRLAEESPAHRQNMLSRSATRVGCGVARGTLPGSEQPIVYLTELFAEPVEYGADRRAPEARVREAIRRERSRAGAAPLTPDPVLDRLAREAAREMLRDDDPAPRTLAEDALAQGRKLAAADGFVASKVSDATRSDHVADPRFHRVGVGVVVGDSDRLGAGLLWVAVVYTD